MLAGRPPEGDEHIDRLSASHRAKQRLKAIVDSLHGETTVTQACERLAIRASRFHAMRVEALQAAVERLEPRAPGRRRRHRIVQPGELEQLEQRVADLERELVTERTRTDVALVTPQRVWGSRSRGGP